MTSLGSSTNNASNKLGCQVTVTASGLKSSTDPDGSGECSNVPYVYAYPHFYTKTELQTSGNSQVHWDNVTNKVGAATELGDLSDVDLTGVAHDKILKYNSVTTNFEIADDEGTTYTDVDAVAAIKADADWDATNWDTAYDWGDHGTEGYLTVETDPTVGAHIKGITVQQTTDLSNLSGTNTGDNTVNTSSLGLNQTVSQTIINGQPIFDTLTASQMVATDASKKLQSLAVATYPSLAELSYVKGATSTIQTQVNGRKQFHGVLARPVGATNPLPTTLTTTTFTLGATANPISYYYRGTLIPITSDRTTVLDDGLGGSTAGIYYVYFNGAIGNILATKVFPGVALSSNVIIATVIWNGTNYGLVNDERHGYARNPDWHGWAHSTIGARYRSGLTLTHNSGTGAAATFATTAGEIWDEDIVFTVNASSAFPTANAGRLFYQTGASAYAFLSTTATTPGYLGVNNRPNYVNTTGYVLTEMSSAVNRYINVFVYGTTDLHTPIYFFTESVSSTIAGANGYTSLTLARAVPFPNLATFGLSPELKALYRLIWRADGALQAIDTTQDDYRIVSSLPMAAGNTSTTASAVTFSPAGNITSTTVQTAIEELDTEKLALTGGTVTGDVTFSNNILVNGEIRCVGDIIAYYV